MSGKLLTDGVKVLVRTFLAGFLVVTVMTAVVVPASQAALAAWRDDYVSSFEAGAGEELAIVFIGSADCGFSMMPGLPRAIKELKKSVQREAADVGVAYRTVGVALDQDAQSGLRFLRRFGAFDEIAAGGGHDNAAALRFIRRDFPGTGATPQLLLLGRTSPLDAGGRAAEQEILRLVGTASILAWANEEPDRLRGKLRAVFGDR